MTVHCTPIALGSQLRLAGHRPHPPASMAEDPLSSINPDASHRRSRGLVASPCQSAIAAAMACIATQSTLGQCGCLELGYSTSTGLPAAPCWSPFVTGPGTASVSGSVLTITSGASIYAFESLARGPYRWTDGQIVEARMRVPLGGYAFAPGFRGASFLHGADSDRIVVSAWIWSTGVALATDANVLPGQGFEMIEFDAASQFHTYTVVTDANWAVLNIDGVERIRLPYTSLHPSAANTFSFGNDSRYSSLAISEWEDVRFSALTAPTPQVVCSNAAATFTVSAAATGPLSYQWQYRGGLATDWTNLSDGVNLAGGQPLLSASGTATASVTIQPGAGVWPPDGEVRCAVSASCGASHTRPAALKVAPDMTTGATPGQAGYGIPDGVINSNDFFFYLSHFAAGNQTLADLTGAATPGQPGYGVPDGQVTNDDFFYYLAVFASGC